MVTTFRLIEVLCLKLLLLAVLCSLANLAQSQNQYNSLLWEISGNNLPHTGFLFGTIHSNDKTVLKLRREVSRGFAACSTVALELDFDPASFNVMELLHSAMMDSSTKLSDLLPVEDYALVENYFKKKLGPMFEMLIRMQPIFLVIMVDEEILDKMVGNSTGKGTGKVTMDEMLQQEAEKKGKQVVGLETAQEQLAAISNVPLKEQARMLLEAVKDQQNKKEEDARELDKLLALYQTEDLGKLYEEVTAGEYAEEFTSSMIVNRNYVMADRLEPILAKEPLFIGVGAAHLPGTEGIIEILRKRGYTVTAR